MAGLWETIKSSVKGAGAAGPVGAGVAVAGTAAAMGYGDSAKEVFENVKEAVSGAFETAADTQLEELQKTVTTSAEALKEAQGNFAGAAEEAGADAFKQALDTAREQHNNAQTAYKELAEKIKAGKEALEKVELKDNMTFNDYTKELKSVVTDSGVNMDAGEPNKAFREAANQLGLKRYDTLGEITAAEDKLAATVLTGAAITGGTTGAMGGGVIGAGVSAAMPKKSFVEQEMARRAARGQAGEMGISA